MIKENQLVIYAQAILVSIAALCFLNIISFVHFTKKIDLIQKEFLEEHLSIHIINDALDENKSYLCFELADDNISETMHRLTAKDFIPPSEI